MLVGLLMTLLLFVERGTRGTGMHPHVTEKGIRYERRQYFANIHFKDSHTVSPFALTPTLNDGCTLLPGGADTTTIALN